MRLCTFTHEGSTTPRVGVLAEESNKVVDLQLAHEAITGEQTEVFTSMLAFLDGGSAGKALLEETWQTINASPIEEATHQVDSVNLLAPIPRPRSVRDCMAFETHLLQATKSVARTRFPLLARFDRVVKKLTKKDLIGIPKVWYQQPLYYKSNPHSVVGHEHEILWPLETEFLDYELEFGVFIGKKGRNIPVEKASEYIAGYTIFNDLTARDVQLEEMRGRLGPAKGKDFDTGNVIGPFLVTPNDVPDPYALTMTARINGEEWSRGTTADMHFTFPEIIAHISRDETLYPGEFIGSGTVGGGCGLELGRRLSSGDVVELEVENLGVLRNKIAD